MKVIQLVISQLIKAYMSNLKSSKEFIVYQMGKVGSSAVVDAIDRAGFKAHQSHFLTLHTFENAVRRFQNPDLNEHDRHHLSSQLQRNLLLFNMVKKYQKYKTLNGEKLNVITLAREPMNWYFANLVQNFDSYNNHIINWLDQKFGIKKNLDDINRADAASFINDAVLLFDSEISKISGNHVETIHSIRKNIHSEGEESRYKLIILAHLELLMRPHVWFDHNFTPLFDVDVLGFEELGRYGFACHENDYMRLVVMRYENLQDVIEKLKDFFDIPDLALDRVNESSAKRYYDIVKNIEREIDFPESFMNTYYSSRYCKALGYMKPDRKI